MKCIAITREALAGGRNGRSLKSLNAAFAQLDSHNIEYTRIILEELSAAAIADLHNNYDFVFLPFSGIGFDTFYDDATMKLPVIGLDTDTPSGQFGATGGVTGVRGSIADKFVTGAWCTNAYTALYGYSGYELTGDGAAITTVSVIDPLTGSAQVGAGGIVMWSGGLAGGKRQYQSAVVGTAGPVFTILLQTAINDGQIINDGTLRKAPIICDLDHINGETVHTDPTTLDYIAAQIGGGMMWGGIQNDSVNHFENMLPATQAKLREHQTKGTFKFCYHSHRDTGGEQPNTGTWPIITHGGTLEPQITQAEELAIYDADEATWNAFGLDFHYPAHYNPGGNNWNLDTLEFMSPKGFVSVRMDASRNCDKVGPALRALYFNQWKVRREFMGIRLFFYHDMHDNFNTIGKARNNFRNILESVGFGFCMYLHDDDFDQTAQEPEAGKVGSTICEMINDIGSYCPDLVVPFADITEFV